MITILGKGLIVWTGLIGMLFLFLAVLAVKLQRKVKKLIGWHQKLAPVAVLFALIHFVLAIMGVFFGVYV